MKLNIKEFNEQYPHYNLGFKASNPKTKTEEVIGLTMHIMYSPSSKKVYQEFFLYDKYHALYEALLDRKAHQFSMSINGNTFNVILKLVDRNIIGVCLETQERIAFSEGYNMCIITK